MTDSGDEAGVCPECRDGMLIYMGGMKLCERCGAEVIC